MILFFVLFHFHFFLHCFLDFTECMNSGLDVIIQELNLLFVLMRKQDLPLYEHIKSGLPELQPFFAISWVLTWYFHFYLKTIIHNFFHFFFISFCSSFLSFFMNKNKICIFLIGKLRSRIRSFYTSYRHGFSFMDSRTFLPIRHTQKMIWQLGNFQ